MRKFTGFLGRNGWDILVAVLLLINIIGILTNDGHDQIMSAVTFWGLLTVWKIDGVLEKFADSAHLRPITINVTEKQWKEMNADL